MAELDFTFNIRGNFDEVNDAVVTAATALDRIVELVVGKPEEGPVLEQVTAARHAFTELSLQLKEGDR